MAAEIHIYNIYTYTFMVPYTAWFVESSTDCKCTCATHLADRNPSINCDFLPFRHAEYCLREGNQR